MSGLLKLDTGADPSMSYEAFLREKVAFDRAFGFEVEQAELSPVFQPGHPDFKPHQAAVIRWAVRGGRRAIFAKFGLGKSVMQMETLRLILTRQPGKALIVAPLGVRREFIHDGLKLLGIDVRFVRRTEELDGDGIYVTNYESVRDGKLDPAEFVAVSLDEASVLRSFGSKTYQEFLTLFDAVPFRFVATATPSPNRHKELIHYAGFLGIMDTGAALTRFFQRDSTHAGNLTLYPHKEREFWLWLNTWACFIQRPSDLGFSDEGYALPSLDVQWHQVEVELASVAMDRDGQGVLVRGGAMSSVEASREKRDTIDERLNRVLEIIRARVAEFPGDPIVLWCDLNDEQAALEHALNNLGLRFSSVHGSLSDEEVERRLDAWLDGDTQVLIGKPVMLGQGMNLQRAAVAIFAGVTYKFNDTIQAVHRIHRFGQQRPCSVHLIYAETESEVRDSLQSKWIEHDELTETMSDIIRAYGLNSLSISDELTRAMGVERQVAEGADWLVALNDSVVEVRDHMADCSVDFMVTSIPFGNHYEYSLNYGDFGHTDDNGHFWWQMDYLTPGLYRTLKPGRILAVHVKDRIQFGNVTGAGLPTVSPFHAEAIAHYTSHGFDYCGVIVITTDVVRENNQTYRLSYSKMLKDGSNMGVGSPEFVLLFHKPQSDRSKGWADERIVKQAEDYSLARWQLDAPADWRSSGDRLLTVPEMLALAPDVRQKLFTARSLENVYDFQAHLEIAEALAEKGQLPKTFAHLVPGSPSPWVWHDVDRMRTLNGEQSRRALEFHICPLQFDIVDRLIERYSMPGEMIYDPFGGLGTVPLRARKLGRQGRMSELNPTSYRDAVMYQRELDRAGSIPTLFDLIDAEMEAAS